jgi:hypothetical protein
MWIVIRAEFATSASAAAASTPCNSDSHASDGDGVPG